MKESDVAVEVKILPDNWQSFNVFLAMSTQWRCCGHIPVGLDYGVLPEIWRRLKIPVKDRDFIFEDLRVMEDAALEAINV